MINRERDKARKIINQLLEIYVLNGFYNIKMNVDIEEDNRQTVIFIKGNMDYDVVDIDELKTSLSLPRMAEYDDYYDGLLENSHEESMIAVGYLTDEAEVIQEESVLSIRLVRKYMNI